MYVVPETVPSVTAVAAEAQQLEDLVGAGRDDAVGLAHERRLHLEAARGARVALALVAPLHDAERVERQDDRHAERARGRERRPAAHPEVGVHHVGSPPLPLAAQVGGEVGHVRQQGVLADDLGRAGGHVVDDDAGRELHPPGGGAVLAAGVHHHVDPAPAHRLGERGDVHVLPAGVDAAEHGEGAGVLGHHGDPHAGTS